MLLGVPTEVLVGILAAVVGLAHDVLMVVRARRQHHLGVRVGMVRGGMHVLHVLVRHRRRHVHVRGGHRGRHVHVRLVHHHLRGGSVHMRRRHMVVVDHGRRRHVMVVSRRRMGVHRLQHELLRRSLTGGRLGDVGDGVVGQVGVGSHVVVVLLGHLHVLDVLLLRGRARLRVEHTHIKMSRVAGKQAWQQHLDLVGHGHWAVNVDDLLDVHRAVHRHHLLHRHRPLHDLRGRECRHADKKE